MNGSLWRFAMGLLPKRAFSRLVGGLVNLPLPQPLGRKSIESFAKFYDIDTAAAERPLSEYRTIGEFFTRRLKPGLRPIGPGVVHPADALITQAGLVDAGTLIQAKGKTYTVSGLLGGNQFASRFEGGHYLTYYLCPTDYHRVHAPVDGRVIAGAHIPGVLWPVNFASVENVDGLFARNERALAVIETEKGLAALVMVAAVGVGNMTLFFDRTLDSAAHAGESGTTKLDYEPALTLRRGDEFGVFNMGSTVIMLYEKGVLDADPSPLRGIKTLMGAPLQHP
jgi:phosphatidylserine decarboxylase